LLFAEPVDLRHDLNFAAVVPQVSEANFALPATRAHATRDADFLAFDLFKLLVDFGRKVRAVEADVSVGVAAFALQPLQPLAPQCDDFVFFGARGWVGRGAFGALGILGIHGPAV
jgi:hypothetical protein